MSILAQLTEPKAIEEARKQIHCSLALFEEGLKAGFQIIDKLEKDNAISGELSLHELVTNTEMSKEIMVHLQEFQQALGKPILSCELPMLRKDYLTRLRLYGSDQFYSAKSREDDPERDQNLKIIKEIENRHEDYDKYNQAQTHASDGKLDSQKLQQDFEKLYEQLTENRV